MAFTRARRSLVSVCLLFLFACAAFGQEESGNSTASSKLEMNIDAHGGVDLHIKIFEPEKLVPLAPAIEHLSGCGFGEAFSRRSCERSCERISAPKWRSVRNRDSRCPSRTGLPRAGVPACDSLPAEVFSRTKDGFERALFRPRYPEVSNASGFPRNFGTCSCWSNGCASIPHA